MKIVTDGQLGDPAKWTTTVKCGKKDPPDTKGCGAEMEITATDLILMYWEGTHFTHHYAAVRCPQCGKYNRVKDVPEPIYDKLDTARNRRKAVFDGFSESIW